MEHSCATIAKVAVVCHNQYWYVAPAVATPTKQYQCPMAPAALHHAQLSPEFLADSQTPTPTSVQLDNGPPRPTLRFSTASWGVQLMIIPILSVNLNSAEVQRSDSCHSCSGGVRGLTDVKSRLQGDRVKRVRWWPSRSVLGTYESGPLEPRSGVRVDYGQGSLSTMVVHHLSPSNVAPRATPLNSFLLLHSARRTSSSPGYDNGQQLQSLPSTYCARP
ncbi:hypothetical protein C8Q73DRAFT_86538 [Cubamyces lactineus]|nr:hypothetical protein C8Q73DRAFT_86538 [Cubamyces lactineus]